MVAGHSADSPEHLIATQLLPHGDPLACQLANTCSLQRWWLANFCFPLFSTTSCTPRRPDRNRGISLKSEKALTAAPKKKKKQKKSFLLKASTLGLLGANFQLPCPVSGKLWGRSLYLSTCIHEHRERSQNIQAEV